ncbi:MAG: carboxypeptidase regulatory-like domain-containing protein [Hyphomicrobiales bacterium]|nr:carboxypeptidase regulatory-like domain-containing protein [Hyphomicrobiales bacterium]MBV8824907.1 carboxypeptidase regulatory-like domain-containing protein [Hyphomicrobiales bacterium]MBV9428340.1 carboxypeptidase regulatory-like domain-containing protein [Bradyrhizobiaceae bacterium]
MNRTITAGLAALLALGPGCGLAGTALAGGSTLDEDDHHAYYFGSVKDTNGAAVENAKVKVQTKTIALMTQSDITGAYKLPILAFQTNPDDVTFSCSKDGYRQLDVIRRSAPGGDAKDPIEIDCTLQRE